MAISTGSQHRSSDSCKVVPGRCNCSTSRRNRNSKVLLVGVLLAAVSMLATGLAEPLESTTQPTELASSDTEVVKQDDRIRADQMQFGTPVDELEDDSYVSLSDGGLEQEIRDAVRSEVESEIEAGASDLLKPRQEEHPASSEQIMVTSSNDNAVAREPKTLETDAVVNEELIAETETEPEKESELEKATDSETAESRHRPLPNVTSDLVSVIFNENRAITEQPITKTNLLALEQEHKNFELKDTTPAPVYDPPKHQVTKKQGVEDLLPIEVTDVPEVETENERQDRQLEPQAVSFEPVAVTPLPDIEENIIDNEISSQPEIEVSSSSETSVSLDLDETEMEVRATSPAEEEAQEDVATNAEPTAEPSDANEEASNDIDIVENTTIEQNHSAETSTDIIDETTIQSVKEEIDRPKDECIDRADDSTATPLVSYPPHDAGQTFDSNLADERTAHLSLASTNRSTLIIALCSGTAVIFIIISLVIFVVSFQRQHGTLDIEMQEQRHGKDTLDEEDAQMKLLDVDLSTPVILVSMGTEETDECL